MGLFLLDTRYFSIFCVGAVTSGPAPAPSSNAMIGTLLSHLKRELCVRPCAKKSL